MVLEVVLESVFAVTDVFFVSRLGEHAIATVGLTESMMAIVYTLAVGLSIGATATVARRIGERNPAGAARAAVQTLALGAVISVGLAIVGVIFRRRCCGSLARRRKSLNGIEFHPVMLGGNASVVMFPHQRDLRGAGTRRSRCASSGSRTASTSCSVHALSGRSVPGAGCHGAAIATTIGRGTGAAFALYRLFQPGRHIQVTREHLRLERCSWRESFDVGHRNAPGVHRNGELDRFSLHSLAFGSAALRRHNRDCIILFALFRRGGWERGGTMVGQALGAKNPSVRSTPSGSRLLQPLFPGDCRHAFVAPRNRSFDSSRGIPPCSQMRSTGCASWRWDFRSMRMAWWLPNRSTARGTRGRRLIQSVRLLALELPSRTTSAFAGHGPQGRVRRDHNVVLAPGLVSALLFRRGKWS